MSFRNVEFGPEIRHFPDPDDLVRVRFGNEHHLMPLGGDQVAYDVQKLPRIVLVDKQELQSSSLV
jgi:hypothetical protein